jgi:predicted nucleic-acid-binding protein
VIGLDTNILVRYIAQDEPSQSALATKLVEGFTAEAPGFVSTVTLVETVWVLARAYSTGKVEILQIVEGLLRARELVVEDAETHYLALNQFEATTVDYADAVIAQAGRRAGCEFTATFDRRAASGGMRLLQT